MQGLDQVEDPVLVIQGVVKRYIMDFSDHRNITSSKTPGLTFGPALVWHYILCFTHFVH